MSDEESRSPSEVMASECLAVRLRVLTRVVTGIYDDALRPLGLKGTQLTLLVAISRLGPVQPARLCEGLQMDASTLSRNAERLEARGWVRTVPGEDGRSHLLTLTPEGEQLLLDAMGAWREAQAKAETVLGPDGVEMLRGVTRRLFGR